MKSSYDGIILGTGHNALVLQAYLARSGLETISLDRAATPGGGLSTIENPRAPGFLHNPHSFFHRGITAMPWFRDLELERHGVRYVEPELNVAMLLEDGRTLEWWTDLDRTVERFAELSKRDAAKMREWAERFAPIVEKILVPESQSPPLAPDERQRWLESTAEGRTLLEVSALSPLEFVAREFENDSIRAGLLFFNGLREVDLRVEGFGHTIPALLASSRKAQMCVGGSAELAHGLCRAIEEHGGEVRCGVEIARILRDGNRASGVELSTGKRLEARAFVASGLNPQQTFLQLLDVDDPLRERTQAFRYNRIAPLFGLHLALEAPPRYEAAEARPELDDAFMVIVGLDRFAQFEEIVRAHESGTIPGTVAWGACPTRFDASQAPTGKHTAFLWEKLPYALRGDVENWQTESSRHAETVLEKWREYAPNLTDDAIVDRFALSPLETERDLPNMRGADLLVGSFENGQVGYDRPFRGAGLYRTSIEGLYLCGGSTHPGGNITGLCGYNAASVISAQLELPTWWAPTASPLS